MEFVDKDWIEHTLKECNRTWSLREILDIECTNAVDEGHNYVGDLLRLKVKFLNLEGKIEERFLIYKMKPIIDNGIPADRLTQLFENEAKVYTTILRKVSEFLQMKDPESEIFWPEFYGVKGENECCLMEDLSVDGFKMVDRRQELDFGHLKICLEPLAKYHAANATLLEKGIIEKDLIETNRIFFATNEMALDYFLGRALKAIVQLIENNWSPEWLEYAEKLRKSEQALTYRIFDAFDRKDYSFVTLNHGDCWSNNILFKYDEEGCPIKVKFVDFQIPFVNSPCLELHYFLSANMKLELLDKETELLQIYYKSLEHFLKLFGYGGIVPTFEELLQDFEKSKLCGLLTTVMLKAFFLNPSYQELARELNITDVPQKYALPLYHQDEYYWKILQTALKTMNEYGFFENIDPEKKV